MKLPFHAVSIGEPIFPSRPVRNTDQFPGNRLKGKFPLADWSAAGHCETAAALNRPFIKAARDLDFIFIFDGDPPFCGRGTL